MLTVLVESGKEVTELPSVVEGTVVELAPAIGFEAMVVEEPREDREEVRREIIEDMMVFWLFSEFRLGLPSYLRPFPPRSSAPARRVVCERKKNLEGPIGLQKAVAGVRRPDGWVVWLM